MNIKLGKILCAIDFSEFSTQVIQCAETLALRYDARLIVFHAVSSSREVLYDSSVLPWDKEQLSLVNSALEKIRTIMQGRPPIWEARVRIGPPVDVIARMVHTEALDLVVAASHGLSGFKRILFGTVVERLARKLARPLLVVRSAEPAETDAARQRFDFKRIAVGCDFSLQSLLALRYAVSMARAYRADLYLLHAMESPLAKEQDQALQGSYGHVQQTLQNDAIRRLAEMIPEDVSGGLISKTFVVPGIPGEQLTRFASRNDVNLVVVGVRYHAAFEKLLIGSTTEALLRHSPCAVLVVPFNISPQSDAGHETS